MKVWTEISHVDELETMTSSLATQVSWSHFLGCVKDYAFLKSDVCVCVCGHVCITVDQVWQGMDYCLDMYRAISDAQWTSHWWRNQLFISVLLNFLLKKAFKMLASFIILCILSINYCVLLNFTYKSLKILASFHPSCMRSSRFWWQIIRVPSLTELPPPFPQFIRL
jgi:hypothetical protein